MKKLCKTCAELRAGLYRKLSSGSGETLIETLAAIIVAVLALLFLSTSVVTATHINKTVEKADTSFNYPTEDAAAADSFEVVIKDDTNNEVGRAAVYQYTDGTGYYKYYKGVNDNDQA